MAVPPLSDPEERVETLRRARPGAYDLGRILSLAARVERSLLRRARLLLADVDASAEADLWVSQVVASQTPQGFVFDRGAAEVLRAHLAADRALLDRAWRLVAWEHREAPWPVRAEEMIHWLTAGGPAGDVERAEQVLIATARKMVESSDHRSAGQWVMRALLRLPPSLDASPVTRAVRAGVAVQVDGRLDLDGDLPSDAMENWLPWLTAGAVEPVHVGVAFGDGCVDFDTASAAPSSSIAVPDTSPLVLDLRWHDGVSAQSNRVLFERGERRRVAVSATEVELRAIDGTRHLVRRAGTRTPGAGLDFGAIRSRHRPFFAREAEVEELDAVLRERQAAGIIGADGIGKSALLCRYLDLLESRHEEVLVHFLADGPESWREPATVEASLIAQFQARRPREAALAGQHVPLVEQLLRSPVDRPLYILLDGLDPEGGGEFMSALTSRGIPRNVHLLYMSRFPMDAIRGQHVIDLDERTGANDEACRRYLDAILRPVLSSLMQPVDAGEWLLARADGVIGRLVTMAEWIRAHPGPVVLEQMPPTLYDGFDDAWQRVREGSDSSLEAVVGMLGVALGDVSTAWVAQALNIARDDVSRAIARLASHGFATPRSLAQSLEDETGNATGVMSTGHAALADESLRAPITAQLDDEDVRRYHALLAECPDADYRLRYRLRHLVDAGQSSAALAEGTDLDRLTQICEGLGVANLGAQLAYLRASAHRSTASDDRVAM